MKERLINSHGKLRLTGTMCIPGDKSSAHRALLFGSLARGTTFVRGVPWGEDIDFTISTLRALGVSVERLEDAISITGIGNNRFRTPEIPLDCQGSGTTFRLLLGLLAGRVDEAILTGNSALRSRPMNRVVDPLRSLGASIEYLEEEGKAPIRIRGVVPLRPGRVELEVSSAQVKTAVILAAMGVKSGRTTIAGAIHSRDHTERLLPRMGGSVVATGNSIVVEPCELSAIAVSIPGDTSTAAVFAAGAALGRDSDLTIVGVGINPSRMGFFEALSWMGTRVDIEETGEDGREPVGTIRIRWAPLKAITVHEEAVPSLVDEVTLLMLLGTQAEGTTEIRGIGELRFKETDRLRCAADGLTSMGANIETGPDWAKIHGPTPLKGAQLNPEEDHRMSMMFTLASHLATGKSRVLEVTCETKSCPNFYEMLESVS